MPSTNQVSLHTCQDRRVCRPVRARQPLPGLSSGAAPARRGMRPRSPPRHARKMNVISRGSLPPKHAPCPRASRRSRRKARAPAEVEHRKVAQMGALHMARCHAMPMLADLRACSRERLPRNINVTRMPPVGSISVVTRIRTDTTLDHSQKAEKVCTRVQITRSGLQVASALSATNRSGSICNLNSEQLCAWNMQPLHNSDVLH